MILLSLCSVLYLCISFHYAGGAGKSTLLNCLSHRVVLPINTNGNSSENGNKLEKEVQNVKPLEDEDKKEEKEQFPQDNHSSKCPVCQIRSQETKKPQHHNDGNSNDIYMEDATKGHILINGKPATAAFYAKVRITSVMILSTDKAPG